MVDRRCSILDIAKKTRRDNSLPAHSLLRKSERPTRFKRASSYSLHSTLLRFFSSSSAREPAPAASTSSSSTTTPHNHILNAMLRTWSREIPLLAQPAAEDEPGGVLQPFLRLLLPLRLLRRLRASIGLHVVGSPVPVRVSVPIAESNHPRRLIVRERARHRSLPMPGPCCGHSVERVCLLLRRQMPTANRREFSPHEDAVFPSHHDAFRQADGLLQPFPFRRGRAAELVTKACRGRWQAVVGSFGFVEGGQTRRGGATGWRRVSRLDGCEHG